MTASTTPSPAGGAAADLGPLGRLFAVAHDGIRQHRMALAGSIRHECVAASDGELLRMSGQHPDYFSEFYRRHSRPVLGFLVRRTGCAQTAADILSETFMAAFKHRRRFDESRGSAEAWLYGIARNQLGRYQRSATRHDRRMRRLDMPQLTADEMTRVEEVADLEALRPHLEDALDALPPRQAEAVRLRVIEELSYREVAEALGTTEGNIRVRVSRGLTRLAELVDVA